MKNKVLWISVIVVIGFILGARIIYDGVQHLIGETHRILTPADTYIDLKDGSYTVFHEHISSYDGKFITTSTEDINGLTFKVTDSEGGKIEVSSSKINSTYTVNSRQGYSIFSFDIEQAGRYHIIIENDQEVMININNMNLFGFFKSIVAFVVLFVVIGITVVLIIVKKKKYDEDNPYED